MLAHKSDHVDGVSESWCDLDKAKKKKFYFPKIIIASTSVNETMRCSFIMLDNGTLVAMEGKLFLL